MSLFKTNDIFTTYAKRGTRFWIYMALASMTFSTFPSITAAEPTNPLPRNAISHIANQRQMQMGACYMLGAGETLIGQYRVTFTFDVRPNGRVAGLRVMKTTQALPFVETCLLQELASWRFPKPHGGRTVRVVYPVTFHGITEALASR